MNGSPSAQVPVTTLAGVASLTDLVQLLPVPRCCPDANRPPQAASSSNCSPSLLFHPRVGEEANRQLSLTDPALLQQLTTALLATHTEDIDIVGEDDEKASVNLKTAPPLLRALLGSCPDLFLSHKRAGVVPVLCPPLAPPATGPAVIQHAAPTNASHPSPVPADTANKASPVTPSNQHGFSGVGQSPTPSTSSSSHSPSKADSATHAPPQPLPQHTVQQQQLYQQQLYQQPAPPQQLYQPHLQSQQQLIEEQELQQQQEQQQHQLYQSQQHLQTQQQLIEQQQHQQQQFAYQQQLQQQQFVPQQQQPFVDQQQPSLVEQHHQDQFVNHHQQQQFLNQQQQFIDHHQQQQLLVNHHQQQQQQQQQQLSPAFGYQHQQFPDQVVPHQVPLFQVPPEVPALGVAPHHQQVFAEAHARGRSGHQGTGDCGPQEQRPAVTPAAVANNANMKEPVVLLSKLTSQDLQSVSNSHHHNSFNNHNDASTDKHHSRSGRSTSSRRSKYQEQSSSEESDGNAPKQQAKYFKSRDKERQDKKKKDKEEQRKRRRIQSDDEDDYVPEDDTGGANKRRKKSRRDEDMDYSMDEEDDEEAEAGKGAKKSASRASAPVLVRQAEYTNKRIERKVAAAAHNEKMSPEELMESGVYQRFNRAIEKVFDNAEEVDVTAEIEEDGDVPQEYLIPKHELTTLCTEAAKLKSAGAMSVVPTERLVRLMHILEKNIRDGAKVTPLVDEDDDDDDKLWQELVMERIMRGVDASLTALFILTSTNMHKRVYLEDLIERCVQFSKFQLSNTIYPAFDPVYRIDSKKDGYVGNVKKRRSQIRDVRDRNILSLYNKLHQLVGLLADLLTIQTLTDTAVLQLSTMGVAPFFVENVSELQLSALKLVTRVFAKYEKHRRLLLDDILASIARLPSSKRSLRTYRLNSDENVQMLTALVLQLIQCVVDLPDHLNRNTKTRPEANNSSPEKSSKEKEKDGPAAADDKGASSSSSGGTGSMDRDVLVSNRYETAMGTAYSFLSVFLAKTGSKSEEIDYRPLFENFVQDLLLTVNKPEWPAAELLLSLLGKLLVQKFSNQKTDVTLRVASLDCLGVVAARLRRDAVSSQLKVSTIDGIISRVREEEDRNAPLLEDGTVPSEASRPHENGVKEDRNSSSSSKKSKKKRGSSSGSHRHDDTANSSSISCSVAPPPDEEEQRCQFLQRVLLDWLAVNAESDVALLHARHFYIGQWYRDAFSEILRQKRGPVTPRAARRPQQHRKRRKRKGESSDDESAPSSDEDIRSEDQVTEELKTQVKALAESRKLFLLTKVSAFPPASPGARTQTLQTHLGYDDAELITRYLASKRSFSQSFDVYLQQILRVLTESAIIVRTKAMKCLTMVVEADPAVLARTDMQMGVHHSFLDHSTSVREAAVDLVGKFVLSRPELLENYYEMIAARILDTGVSVRKRVIKIMKDVCLECPDFDKIPEICVKMIRRVNDEEGIKKLVQEVFQNMWFTPVRERPSLDEKALVRKVNNITQVVITCQDSGLDWFYQLLQSMFRPKEDKEDVTKIHTEPPKALVTSCKQIVDCLVRHILLLEENNPAQVNQTIVTLEETSSGATTESASKTGSASQKLVACLKTLHLLAKIRPQLLVDHAITLQPYLSLKCQTQGDYTLIGVVARTLELVVPLMEHPSESFLAQLEEDAVKLILQHDRTVITSCLALLGSIVNTVTRNYRLIRDCFNKYYSFIVDYKKLHMENPVNPKLEQCKPFFRRALYTVGLLLRHFDFNNEDIRIGLPETITFQVVDTLLYFMQLADIGLKYFTLQSLGSVCIRHYELMLTDKLRDMYHTLLLDKHPAAVQLRVQTLCNIETYLQEEDIRMMKEDQEWAKTKTKENLKEMHDVQSGMASAIIQLYLKQVLECSVSGHLTVRHAALRVTQLVLAQGLVHPVQIVPYLVCMSTDNEEMIAHSADKQVQDIEKKYPGFVSMKAMQGFRLSYRLQTLIQTVEPTRGFREKTGEIPGALNSFLYSTMRGTKQQRRAVAISLLRQFDEMARTPLQELLYIADNLAYFPYQVLDEPLFIIYHIDLMISTMGSNLLQSFREALLPPPDADVKYNPETGRPEYLDDDADDDSESLLTRCPVDMTPLLEAMLASQGCQLLLVLKEYLKEVYGITDGKLSQYSPSDSTKQYEKGCNKRSTARFKPKQTLQRMKENPQYEPREMNDKAKIVVIEEYLDFKALMLKIDPEDEDEEEGGEEVLNADGSVNKAATRATQQQDARDTVILLPGTHDGWQEKPRDGSREMVAAGYTEAAGVPGDPVDLGRQQGAAPPHQHENRTPIKPLTIKTSQLTTPHHRSSRSHRSHHKSSSSSHKKHKKKKKRRRLADSEDEGEDSDSDDDWA